MQIGILGGTGPAGSALGVRLASVGFDVVIGSRSKYRAMEVVDKLHEQWPALNLSVTAGDNAAAGEVLEYNDFNHYVTSKRLQKQEGIIFRHLLRLILLVGEFQEFCPPDCDYYEWQDSLRDIADRLTEICRKVDPESTDKTLEEMQRADNEGADSPTRS